MIYGPADQAGAAFQELLNLQNTTPLEGELEVVSSLSNDRLEKKYPAKIMHNPLFSGGGISTKVNKLKETHTTVLARMKKGNEERDVVWVREKPEWRGGKIAYVRGTNSSTFKGGKLLTPDDPEKYFVGPLYLRYVLKEFGLDYGVEKQDPTIASPVMTVSRSNNGFFFSGYVPNTTVKHRLKFAQGAPVLNGFDTRLENGYSTYSLPTAWHRECRVFVDQPEGIVSSKEVHSGEKGISRRLRITGLNNATVRVYPDEEVTEEMFRVYLNAGYPYKTGHYAFKPGDPKQGKHFVIENVTGNLIVSW